MREELDKKLVAKYPKIFMDRHGDMSETGMCWGFQCGDGWYDLIDTLCQLIQGHVNCKKDLNQIVAFSVKEKFGELRFYVNGSDEHIDGYIIMAEAMSRNICEVCGNRGHRRTGAWIKTLCDEHAKNHQEFDMRMYCIFSREALKAMNGIRGKMTSQAGHAFLDAFVESVNSFPKYANEYMNTIYETKITCIVDTDQELEELLEEFEPICASVSVVDAGLTIFDKPYRTCIGIGPIPDNKAGRLQELELLK